MPLSRPFAANKRFLLPLLLCLLALPALSQSRTELWSRLTVTHGVGDHWVLWGDVQYRRQSDYVLGSHNLLDEPLMLSVRGWVGYKLPHGWMPFVSPVALFHLDQLTAQGQLKANFEYRSAVGTAWSRKLGKTALKARAMNDSRYFRASNTWQQRARLLVQATWPLHSFSDHAQLNLQVSEEVLYHYGKAGNGFDQNRVLLALQQTWHKHDLTAGYQWHIQPTDTLPLNRHIFFLNISLVL